MIRHVLTILTTNCWDHASMTSFSMAFGLLRPLFGAGSLDFALSPNFLTLFRLVPLQKNVQMSPPPQEQNRIDPWLRYDPWAIEKKQMSKWEDLRLPKDHYFKTKDDSSAGQLHRQQLNTWFSCNCFLNESECDSNLSELPEQRYWTSHSCE